MLKLAGSDLSDFDARYKRKNDVCREPLFQMRFDTEGVGCVDQDAGVLRGHNGLYYRGQVVDIGQSLDAEDYIVVCVLS